MESTHKNSPFVISPELSINVEMQISHSPAVS